MSKTKIAIQGELGAYSHIAAESLYKDAEIKTCATFEETFKYAYNDQNFKIVIPIEIAVLILVLVNRLTAVETNCLFVALLLGCVAAWLLGCLAA